MNARVDPGEFRRALGCFPTGVTVVAACDEDGGPRGFTANAFTSVSLEPPLVLVCIDHRAASCPVFRRCAGFTVSILAETQRDTATLFASRAPDKFARAAWRAAAVTGAPVLEDGVAWLECVPHERVDAGDHLVLVGRVVALASAASRPLGYCRGNFFTLGSDRQSVAHPADRRVRVGCILDHRSRVLLVGDEKSESWHLPATDASAGHRCDADSLTELLARLDVEAEPGVLFSVFDGPEPEWLSIYYLGKMVTLPDRLRDGLRLFAHDAIPWSAIPAEAHRAMLGRYVEERRGLGFGVYTGSSQRGSVARRMAGD